MGPSGASTNGQFFKRTYNGIYSHNIIYFSFTLFAIDSIDLNDYFQVIFDSVSITSWSYIHTSSPGDVCGSGWNDLTNIGVSGKAVHSESSVTLQFLFLNDESSVNESWGFRDIVLKFANVANIASQNSQMCGKSSVTFTSNNCDCPQSQYLNTASVCTACNSLCSSCFGPSAQECYQCASGATFNGATCLVCDASCLTCSGPSANQCTFCPSGKYLINSQTCVDSALCIPLPLSPVYNSLGYGVCASPCSPSEYVFYNTSCSPSCSVVYQGSSMTLSCLSECPSPMISSVSQAINICSKPCPSAANKYYNTNKKICQADCQQPYVIGNAFYGETCSLAVNSQDTQTIQTLSDATQKANTATQAGLAAINMATPFSSAAMVLGSLSKLLEYTRYLNITHSPRLELMFATILPSLEIINTNSLGISKKLQDELSVYPAAPDVFDKYGIPASFLVNEWGNIVSFALVLGFVITICMIDQLTSRLQSCRRLRSFSRWTRLASQSYLFGILYGGFGDVVLFSGIELHSILFTSAYTDLSFGLVIASLCMCVLTICFHVRFLVKYQAIRKQDSPGQVQHFREQSESLKLLFEDYFDFSLMQQCFLVFLSVRNIIYGVVLTALYTQPLAQIIIIDSLSIIALIYLLLKKPFKRKIDLIQQAVFELAILTANVCLPGMAILDLSPHEDHSIVRARLGDAFIMINLTVRFMPMICILPKLTIIAMGIYNKVKNRRRQTSVVQYLPEALGLFIHPKQKKQGEKLKNFRVISGSNLRPRSNIYDSADTIDSSRVNLNGGLGKTFAITETLVTAHERKIGAAKQEFYRRIRPEESKDEAINFSSEATSKKPDQEQNARLANYFGFPNQIHEQAEKIDLKVNTDLANFFGLSNQIYKQDDPPPKRKRYIRKVDVDEQGQGHGQGDKSANNSMTIHNMSTLINIYDPTPKVPRNRVSSAGIEIDMSPDQISLSGMNLGHSNLFAKDDSIYPNERIQPFSRIEEVEDFEDNEGEKENNKQEKRLRKKAKMLKAMVDGSESSVFQK